MMIIKTTDPDKKSGQTPIRKVKAKQHLGNKYYRYVLPDFYKEIRKNIFYFIIYIVMLIALIYLLAFVSIPAIIEASSAISALSISLSSFYLALMLTIPIFGFFSTYLPIWDRYKRITTADFDKIYKIIYDNTSDDDSVILLIKEYAPQSIYDLIYANTHMSKKTLLELAITHHKLAIFEALLDKINSCGATITTERYASLNKGKLVLLLSHNPEFLKKIEKNDILKITKGLQKAGLTIEELIRSGFPVEYINSKTIQPSRQRYISVTSDQITIPTAVDTTTNPIEEEFNASTQNYVIPTASPIVYNTTAKKGAKVISIASLSMDEQTTPGKEMNLPIGRPTTFDEENILTLSETLLPEFDEENIPTLSATLLPEFDENSNDHIILSQMPSQSPSFLRGPKNSLR